MRQSFYCLFFISFVFYSQALKAQDTSGGFGLMKASWQIDKKIAVAELMHLSEKQSNAFWPEYDRYMNDWCRVMNSRISSIMAHYNDYKNVTTPSIVYFRDLFANDAELNMLKKKTYKKVRKIVPGYKAKKFMQMEYIFQIVLSRKVQQKAMLIGHLTYKL